MCGSVCLCEYMILALYLYIYILHDIHIQEGVPQNVI
jgi:hypothetical protein